MAYAIVIEAIAEPRRRQILQALKSAPLSVAEIAATQPVSRPAVSQHLKVLVNANLVWAEQKGAQRIYHLRREGLEELRKWLDGFWEDALLAFEAEVKNQVEQDD